RSARPPTPSRYCAGPPNTRCSSPAPGYLAPTPRNWCVSWLAGSGYQTHCAGQTSSPAPDGAAGGWGVRAAAVGRLAAPLGLQGVGQLGGGGQRGGPAAP